MRISLSKSGRSFSAAADRSVLDAALAAGLNLPHSCKSGNCGSCRARLLEGRIAYPHGTPLGISAAEIAAGDVLLCQARADSDLVIELPDIRPAHDAVIKRLPCRIERAVHLSHDVMGVYLRLPAAEEFRFEAGQYIDVMLSAGRRRSFSIASPPHDARPLELHVRRVAGGEFTERLFAGGAANALLDIEGPLGGFVYRPAVVPRAPLLMIGGGTGLAPLLSILRSLAANGVDRDVRLYWGVRAEADLYAHGTLQELGRRWRNLSYVPVLSEASPAWSGRRGLVHAAVLADFPHFAGVDIYASGPPAMIAAVRAEFTARGAAAARLYFDSFDYAPDSPARQRSSASSSA